MADGYMDDSEIVCQHLVPGRIPGPIGRDGRAGELIDHPLWCGKQIPCPDHPLPDDVLKRRVARYIETNVQSMLEPFVGETRKEAKAEAMMSVIRRAFDGLDLDRLVTFKPIHDEQRAKDGYLDVSVSMPEWMARKMGLTDNG